MVPPFRPYRVSVQLLNTVTVYCVVDCHRTILSVTIYVSAFVIYQVQLNLSLACAWLTGERNSDFWHRACSNDFASWSANLTESCYSEWVVYRTNTHLQNLICFRSMITRHLLQLRRAETTPSVIPPQRGNHPSGQMWIQTTTSPIFRSACAVNYTIYPYIKLTDKVFPSDRYRYRMGTDTPTAFSSRANAKTVDRPTFRPSVRRHLLLSFGRGIFPGDI